MPCCLVPSPDIGMVKVPHADQSPGKIRLSVEGLIYLCFLVLWSVADTPYNAIFTCLLFNPSPEPLSQLTIHSLAMLLALQLLSHIEGNMLSSSSQLALPKETERLCSSTTTFQLWESAYHSSMIPTMCINKYTFMHIMGGGGGVKKKDPFSQYCSAATQALIEIWGIPCKHEKHFTVGVCTGFMCQGFGSGGCAGETTEVASV